MILKEEIDTQLETYFDSLQGLINDNDLPFIWFVEPDHVAIKVADAANYEQMLLRLEPMSNDIYATPREERLLGTARLLGKYALGMSWLQGSTPINWVEIMEPRPEEVARDDNYLDHVEFYYPNLTKIQDFLDVDINPFPKANENHSWIELPVNLNGQRVMFSDRRLSSIIGEQVADGRAQHVYSSRL